jgi:APA family basic amino acid/polyamine antiporter
MTTNSAVWGIMVCAIWLVYFYGANLTSGWFGVFNFDSSELPIITIYGMYIPILIAWIKKEKDLSVTKRFILPILSIIACLFMVFAAIYAHGITPYLNAKEAGTGFVFPVLFYIIVYAVVMGLGWLVKKPRFSKKTDKE